MKRRNFVKNSVSFSLCVSASSIISCGLVNADGSVGSQTSTPPQCVFSAPQPGKGSYTETKKVSYVRWKPGAIGAVGGDVFVAQPEVIEKTTGGNMASWTPDLPIASKGGASCPMRFRTPAKTEISSNPGVWRLVKGSVPDVVVAVAPPNYVPNGDEDVVWTRTTEWTAQANVECANP